MAKFLDLVDKFETGAAAAKPIAFPFSKASLASARGLARIDERMKLCISADARMRWGP